MASKKSSEKSDSETEMQYSLSPSPTTSFSPFSPGISKPLEYFHFTDTSEVDTTRKRKAASRKTTSKVVKTAPSEDFSIPQSSMRSLTPSEKKLGSKSLKVPVPTLAIDVQSEDESIVSRKVRKAEGNYVIEIALRKVSVCRKCQRSELDIFEDASTRVHSASCLLIRFGHCKTYQTLWSVSGQFGQPKDTLSAGEGVPAKWNQMEIAVVLSSRMVGIGYESLKMYHAILDIPAPPSKPRFDKILMEMIGVAETTAIESMDNVKQALVKEHSVNSSQDLKIVASFDGAYPKKGKSSHLCFASMICVELGRVLAYDICNNLCAKCKAMNEKMDNQTINDAEYDTWKISHSSDCPANYSLLPIHQVESALAVDLLKQALKRGIIFAGLVSDGDNDTFETLRTTDIYSGAQSCMMEYECLKHVQWQLYKNLSKLNKKELTWNICSKVGHLYYKAVANGSGDIETIVENINGIPSHIESVTGWLSTDTIRLLSQYLSDNKYNSPHFLKRVRYGFTTTHNESLHRMLTRTVPKTGKVTYDTYRLGAALAVIQYNDGVTALATILSRLGIDPRKRVRDLFIELDNTRLDQAKRASLQKQQKLDVIQLEDMKPMKQLQKYDVGYSSRQRPQCPSDTVVLVVPTVQTVSVAPTVQTVPVACDPVVPAAPAVPVS